MVKKPMNQSKDVSYLDHNATTPVLPDVVDAVAECLATFGNPSSVHQLGRRARSAIESAREDVARFVGANASNVVFTSGGTEANALALRGLINGGECRAIVASAVEHPSVLAHVAAADHVPVDKSGRVDLDSLERMLHTREAPVLVALMFANNETGVIQPITETVQLAKAYGALVHCDAVQAPGKVPLDFQTLGIDAMSVSAHKFGGLKGAGALVLRDGLTVVADIPGGGQERSRRAGTENVVGIVALGAAASHMTKSQAQADYVSGLRDKLEAEILRVVPRAKIFGRNAYRLGNTCCVAIRGASSEIQLMRLDLAGVAISAGSACSSGKITPSHVLLAMGVEPQDAKCSIRVSFGWTNMVADVDRFLEAWMPLALNAAA